MQIKMRYFTPIKLAKVFKYDYLKYRLGGWKKVKYILTQPFQRI